MPPTILPGLAMALPWLALASAADGELVSIPIDMRQGRPRLELTIDGGPPMPAIFDTGSISSFASLEMVEKAGLSNDGPAQGKMAQMGAAFQTTLKNPAVGAYQLPTMSLPVMPVPLPDIVAVFAPEIFSGKYVTLNFAAEQLELREKAEHSEPGGARYDYTPPPFEIATLPVAVAADNFNGMMDTGSDKPLLFPLALADSVPLKTPLKQLDGGVRTVHGKDPIPVFEAQIDAVVRIGPIEIKGPIVKFTAAAPRIIVGMPILRQITITLDPEGKRIWVEKL